MRGCFQLESQPGHVFSVTFCANLYFMIAAVSQQNCSFKFGDVGPEQEVQAPSNSFPF